MQEVVGVLTTLLVTAHDCGFSSAITTVRSGYVDFPQCVIAATGNGFPLPTFMLAASALALGKDLSHHPLLFYFLEQLSLSSSIASSPPAKQDK